MTDTTKNSSRRQSGRSYMKLLIVIAVIAGLVILFRTFPVAEWLSAAFTWVKALGPTGYALFIGLYIVVTIIGFPASILTVGAGAAWGVPVGSGLVIVGATLGATGAFLVGRYVARAAVARKVAGNPKFAAVDQAVGSRGFRIVLMTRLSPVFPYNLLNYMYGVTRVTLRDYFLASFIGMIPGTVMYVYIGSIAGDAAGGAPKTLEQEILKYVGLAITVVVTVYVTKLARKALKEAEVDA